MQDYLRTTIFPIVMWKRKATNETVEILEYKEFNVGRRERETFNGGLVAHCFTLKLSIDSFSILLVTWNSFAK